MGSSHLNDEGWSWLSHVTGTVVWAFGRIPFMATPPMTQAFPQCGCWYCPEWVIKVHDECLIALHDLVSIRWHHFHSVLEAAYVNSAHFGRDLTVRDLTSRRQGISRCQGTNYHRGESRAITVFCAKCKMKQTLVKMRVSVNGKKSSQTDL